MKVIRNNIFLVTYLNGIATGDSTSRTSILLSASLLTGINRQTIGMITSSSFDEVRIQFNITVQFKNYVLKKWPVIKLIRSMLQNSLHI